jgi:hypothetical protein
MFSTFNIHSRNIHGRNLHFGVNVRNLNTLNNRFKQPNTFEQIVQIQRKRTFLIEKKLKENLPLCYFIIHAILLINVAIGLMVIQSYGIKYEIPYYNIASGLW